MMIKSRLLYIICFLLFTQTLLAQGLYKEPSYNLSAYTTDSTTIVKKRPFVAAAEVIGLNISVWLFDRYVIKGDYAYIDLSTMKNNLKTGFVWDNDSFSTNLLWHPYQGSLYFNSARSNGMNFWASFPYALGGSLMWELFMENEAPSINDLFSTTIGGTALGEVTFRSSSLILDDSKRGLERVIRELFGVVVSPMRTFNRLTRGSLTRVRAQNSFEAERMPFKFHIGSGWRYLAQNDYFFQGYNGMFIDLGIEYGDPFYNDNYKPFDYFSFKAMFNIGGGQPFIGSLNAIGMLWGQSSEPLPEHDMTVGIFQHYDFYQSDTLNNSSTVPFEVAQTAAIGGGVMYKFPQIGNKINMSYNIYANIILMGGVLTDHFEYNGRNYNMGSGYSLKFQSKLEFSKTSSFFVGVENYSIFTWKGYPNEPNVISVDPHKPVNAQGNKGNTRFTIINPRLDIFLSSKLSIALDTYFYFRKSHYDYFNDVDYHTFETRLLLSYKL